MAIAAFTATLLFAPWKATGNVNEGIAYDFILTPARFYLHSDPIAGTFDRHYYVNTTSYGGSYTCDSELMLKPLLASWLGLGILYAAGFFLLKSSK